MLQNFLQWLYDTEIGTAIREGASAFPWIESFHVLALTIVVGSICVVDLRLMGFTSKHRPVSAVSKEILPYTKAAFAVAVITGFLLFTSNAVKYANNFYFLLKMAVMGAAMINIGIFHYVTERSIHLWDTAPKPPTNVRIAGAVSFLAWVIVVAAGRWIAYSE